MTKPASITIGQTSLPTLGNDGRTIVVRIPISFRRQKGRKQVVTPADAAPWTPRPAPIDNTMIKAVVRAHRWRDMLESGDYATVRDLAKAEAINESYLSRVLRLTVLVPTVVEAILEGRQPASLGLDDLLKPFPLEWDKQLATLTEN